MTCLADRQSFGKLLISKKIAIIYIYSNCFKVVEHCKVCQNYDSFMAVFSGGSSILEGGGAKRK